MEQEKIQFEGKYCRLLNIEKKILGDDHYNFIESNTRMEHKFKFIKSIIGEGWILHTGSGVYAKAIEEALHWLKSLESLEN